MNIILKICAASFAGIAGYTIIVSSELEDYVIANILLFIAGFLLPLSPSED